LTPGLGQRCADLTELVINALKHAFSDGRPGKITVGYNFHGLNWILPVRDDGAGMPMIAPIGTGLGTSIVHALAKQLKASVETSHSKWARSFDPAHADRLGGRSARGAQRASGDDPSSVQRDQRLRTDHEHGAPR
jgi:hypothetical protein